MSNTASMHGRAAAVLLAFLIACDRDPAPSSPTSTPLAASYVVGAAAAALQPDGQFVQDNPESPDGTPMISEKRAGQLALAYVRAFGRSFHETWERERGGAIDLTTLSPGRIYFAHSPYGAFPAGFHPAMRRTYGPYFLVPLQSNGTPVIMMAVSAYNTDVGIDKDGLIVLPKLSGMGFLHSGIPTTSSLYAPLSPEDAVKHAFEVGHARISEPPRLMLLGHTKTPLLAAWQVTLDRDIPTRAHDERASRDVHVILVGPREKERFQRPDENQPGSEDDLGPTVNGAGEVGAAAPFKVPVRTGRSIRATTVTIGPE